jgi:hypothetical protein
MCNIEISYSTQASKSVCIPSSHLQPLHLQVSEEGVDVRLLIDVHPFEVDGRAQLALKQVD